MKVNIFVQSELLKDIEVIDLPTDATYDTLHSACLNLLSKKEEDADYHIFVEDNDDENAAKGMCEIPDGLRVHIHRLKSIDVRVHYAGHAVRRTFRPSATIARVKRWASQELGISRSDAAELMLQIHGTDIRPDADIHIGSLVCLPNKSIAFDLVPSPRINGGNQ